jgi:hypothetical protein
VTSYSTESDYYPTTVTSYSIETVSSAFLFHNINGAILSCASKRINFACYAILIRGHGQDTVTSYSTEVDTSYSTEIVRNISEALPQLPILLKAVLNY